MMVVLIVVSVAALAVVAWCWLFKPFLDLHVHGQLTNNVRDEVLPDIQKASSAITTIAAGAIVLTFSLLQLVYKTGVSAKPFLVSSWIAFGVAILCGTSIGVLVYIFRINYKLEFNAFEDLTKGKERKPAITIDSLIKKTRQIEVTIIILALLQAASFMGAFVFLILVAVSNI